MRTLFLPRAALRAPGMRTSRTLSAIAYEATAETSANTTGSRSVKQRLRETPVPEAVLQRIRKLGLGHERGGAVRLSEETLKIGRRRELGRLGLLNSATTISELPLPAKAELALAGTLAATEASPPAGLPGQRKHRFPPALPAGRSNVGKSSLLNALAGKRSPASTTRGLAPVQNKPGVTRALNFYGSERRGVGRSREGRTPGTGRAWGGAPVAPALLGRPWRGHEAPQFIIQPRECASTLEGYYKSGGQGRGYIQACT
jgi:hypothetical protein